MYRTRTADVRFDGCAHDQKRFLIIEIKEIIHLTNNKTFIVSGDQAKPPLSSEV